MAELTGNLLVAQSGGPTAVINSSVAGVITEAGKHECIEEIYGGLNGILGILNEELIDINDEKRSTIEGLKYTPAAALGTCRYKIDVAGNSSLTQPGAVGNVAHFLWLNLLEICWSLNRVAPPP